MDTTTVLITLIIYKILLITIGLWAERRTKSNEDFFLGGRGLGPVVAAISYSASAASAWTLLGISGAAYVIGLSAIWIVVGAVLGCLIAWVWIAPRMMRYSHDHNIITLTEFLAHESGPDRSLACPSRSSTPSRSPRASSLAAADRMRWSRRT